MRGVLTLMSRIGKNPVPVPDGVTIDLNGQVITASGPKGNDYKFEIEKYIKTNKPFVIALNTKTFINNKLIDIFAACNPLKLIADADLYKSVNAPLAVPEALLSNPLKKKFKKIKLLDL